MTGFFKTRARHLLLTAAALIFILPILFMIVGSLKPDSRVLADAGTLRAFFPREAGFQNYGDVLTRSAFGRYLFNSALINGLIVGIGLLINSMAGYALARLRWRGRGAMLAAVLAGMVIPFEAIAVPLFYMMSLIGWTDSYQVQIVPFIANPFSVFLFFTFFKLL